jgi:hypothetical protein
MKISASPTSENKKKAPILSGQGKQPAAASFQFVDQRPATAAQLKVQGLAAQQVHAQSVGQLKARVAQFASRQAQPIQREKNQNGMPQNLQSGIEQLSGHSLADVKVHYNSKMPAQLNAMAYAQGRNIHVGPGQERHLPHEAWHVVQQAQGRVKPTMQMKGGVPINDNKGLEREADMMGAKALSSYVQRKAIATTSAPAQLQSMDVDEIAQGKFETTQLKAESAGASLHGKGCGCPGCTVQAKMMEPLGTSNTMQAVTQRNAKPVYQLVQCGECFQHNHHSPTCSKYVHKAPKVKAEKKERINHDDGSGYQKSGAGGDRHQKGQRNQIVNAKQENFYRDKKKKQ